MSFLFVKNGYETIPKISCRKRNHGNYYAGTGIHLRKGSLRRHTKLNYTLGLNAYFSLLSFHMCIYYFSNLEYTCSAKQNGSG